MPVDSPAGLADTLRGHHLLEPGQLDELTGPLAARFPDPRALVGELVRRGWLTPYQANQICNGRADDLLLGSYVLLDRLGAGGMGEVYRARNWKLGKTVALKLVRAARVSDAGAVRRFQREVRAAAQLNHPNIVHAFDCDEAGGKHFLVMEYVEGVDLARYVKQHGPLPAALACDCVRQAALGLQHAHARGLVHRDIKPHNLLLTRGGDGRPLVKLLDMGLARLSAAADEGDSISTMTAEGQVMGTLDYIAPEQALNAHTADTRADLYSLGCTLYFLLCGRPPFPGGTATEKLLKHQLEYPEPVEQVRPDVPAAVADIVRRLMAKRPDDRFPTPAEAAAALSNPSAAVAMTEATSRPAVRPSGDDTASGWSSLGETPLPVLEASSSSGQRKARRDRPWLWLAAGSAVVLGSVGLYLLSRGQPGEGPAPPTHAAPAAAEHPAARKPTLSAFDRWVEETAALPADEQVKEVAAKLKERNPDFDGALEPTVADGVVTHLKLSTDHVTDIKPVRALRGLKGLDCQGTAFRTGRLADLAPLTGLPLATLSCGRNPITDLRPLRELPLTTLWINGTLVTDLAPLRGMGLNTLVIAAAPVADLSPLEGMPLHVLNCQNTQVSDLSPLSKLPLHRLFCRNTRVADFSPLRDVPLRALSCDYKPERDEKVLRALKHLQLINGVPVSQLWKDAAPAPKGADKPSAR